MSQPTGGTGSEAAADGVTDPGALMRSRQYRGLLVLAVLIGVVVSIACWCFLQVVHLLQEWVFIDLPQDLGFEAAPWWWPLPPVLLAGLVIAAAIARLPGRGGHEPSEGLTMGAPTTPVQLPGVILAAVATLGLGLVLGPEGPLIALGGGVALLTLDLARRPVPNQARTVLAAAAAFAALATIFGSPIVGAVIIIEAAGLAGPTLPLVLLPGLVAAGTGSLVFVGIGSLTGLSTSNYVLPPLNLPDYPVPKFTDFLWVILLGLVAAIVVFGITTIARATHRLVARRVFLLTPASALLVGVLAIVFAQVGGQSSYVVLFSGQEAMATVVKDATTVSIGTLILLLVCKGLAWAVSMGFARGGSVFPGLFLGLVAGLLVSRLPGLAETPAIGALVGAAVVSVLRLPLSSIILALLITQAGPGVAPLVIVAVAVAYIATLTLTERRDRLPGLRRRPQTRPRGSG